MDAPAATLRSWTGAASAQASAAHHFALAVAWASSPMRAGVWPQACPCRALRSTPPDHWCRKHTPCRCMPC
jgi:hypothetical protein